MNDTIDLRGYLDAGARHLVAELYSVHAWPIDGDDWRWCFADVCALYFRAELPLPWIATVVRCAIRDYLEDEFS
jgi:hypothetical protein